MDFKERFKGRTSTMNKDGVTGIVASSTIPIDKTGAFEDYKRYDSKSFKDDIAMNQLTKITPMNSMNSYNPTNQLSLHNTLQRDSPKKTFIQQQPQYSYHSDKSYSLTIENVSNTLRNTNSNPQKSNIHNRYIPDDLNDNKPILIMPRNNHDTTTITVTNNEKQQSQRKTMKSRLLENLSKPPKSIKASDDPRNHIQQQQYQQQSYQPQQQPHQQQQQHQHNINYNSNISNNKGYLNSHNEEYNASSSINHDDYYYLNEKMNTNMNLINTNEKFQRYNQGKYENLVLSPPTTKPYINRSNQESWATKNTIIPLDKKVLSQATQSRSIPVNYKSTHEDNQNLDRAFSAHVNHNSHFLEQQQQEQQQSREFNKMESIDTAIRKSGYKPYTLKEYKESKELQAKGLSQLGGLGSNVGTEEWQKKREKLEKMAEFAANVKLVNMENSSKLPPLNMRKHKEESTIPKSKREIALEFAKYVPKPKIKKGIENDEERSLEGEKEVNEESELEKYQRQHLNYLNQVQRIKVDSN